VTPLRQLRETVLARLRALPLAQHAWARLRKRRYEAHVSRFLKDGSGHADRLPTGVVYEATMRCNLHCEFCYVGDLLNIEGQWRDELSIDALEAAFPERDGLRVNLTGGEIFMRKDILSVLSLFEEKGYACGCLTTNGTIITEARAEALAELALRGFLKHVSVSIDGPRELHDVARGQKGTFDKTTAGLRRLREAARRRGAPLRISINTTVAHESLETLDQMVDVAGELGIDTIGLNHLMYSTPSEVQETLAMIGSDDASVIATFVTRDPMVGAERVREKVAALREKCRARGVRFDVRPKVLTQIMDDYYEPGAPLAGRCLYPFNWARVSFSGKVYFCPFIRVEVGDLTKQTLEEVWNGEKYVTLRKRLLDEKLFPVCRRCCKVELSPVPVARAAEEAARTPRAIPLTVIR
jgi:MoaA/NifB/PqqE/SkfB family radical SAM enzyme